jgi:hypothetical protein
MNSFVRKHHRVLFYGGWFLLNLLQASFTELFDDEAYYWVYAKFPAWGYFDHPPMIALMIKAGSFLFPGELGVRFFVVISNVLSIYLIEKLTSGRSKFLFYAICASIALAQIGGILAVPDLPLLFFVALFFLLYRRFIENMTLSNSVLLGIVTSLMLYSKYQGILIIFFTVLSNLSLFTKPQFYIVTITALLLFAPHIYWQVIHDYPSVQFHLFERNEAHFSFSYLLEYIAGQLLITGPIAGWLLLWSAYTAKPSDNSERALKFSFVGLYVFFLLSTFKGRVEANWTVPAFVPLIVLSHKVLSENEKLTKILYKLLPFSLLLVILARIFLWFDFPPVSTWTDVEFHENKIWTNDIKQRAGDLPVVIVDSYQKPSKYWFYTNHRAFGLNTPRYRRNNFNYWPIEDSLIDKTVYAVGTRDSLPFKEKFGTEYLEEYGGAVIDHYYSFSRVRFINVSGKATSQEVVLDFKAVAPIHYLSYFRQPPFDTASVLLAIIREEKSPLYIKGNLSVAAIKDSVQEMQVRFPVNLQPGKYAARLGIATRIRNTPSLNSTIFRFEVKER